MVGLHGGYIADKPVVYMTKKGEDWDSDSVIKLDCTVTTEPDESEDAYTQNTWELSKDMELCVVCGTYKTLAPEQKAYILGFKNLNCMNRYIRRMKRKKEQERRRRLKQGVT